MSDQIIRTTVTEADVTYRIEEVALPSHDAEFWRDRVVHYRASGTLKGGITEETWSTVYLGDLLDKRPELEREYLVRHTEDYASVKRDLGFALQGRVNEIAAWMIPGRDPTPCSDWPLKIEHLASEVPLALRDDAGILRLDDE